MEKVASSKKILHKIQDEKEYKIAVIRKFGEQFQSRLPEIKRSNDCLIELYDCYAWTNR